MAAGAQSRRWDRPSRRRVPRYVVQAPLDVTVLRSGIPDTLPGRSVNVCERGIAAVLSGELSPGEAVGVEVRLPLAASPVRTRALVRYFDRLRCGLEFVGLSDAQQAAIRDWVELAKAPGESQAGDDAGRLAGGKENTSQTGKPPTIDSQSGPHTKRRRRRRGPVWTLLLMVAIFLAAAFWWRWNRSWEELESGLSSHPVSGGETRVHVPAEVMQKLLIHQVDPEYPAEGRPARLQGVIVIDVVIGADGSVVQMRPLNGPEILSRAAMDALRWWKFRPYRVNGQGVEAETTVAIEFKSPNG